MQNNLVYIILSIVLFTIHTQSLSISSYPGNYEQWVQERVGPVVYPAPENEPNRGWDVFLGITEESKFKAVKTWLGTYEPGESIHKIQQPHYLELCDTYPVVHFNICSGYLTKGFANGVIHTETLNGIENDWYDCAKFLYTKYKNQKKTFLFSVCAELNWYMGTEGRNPDLPVSDYVNTCEKGLERARKEFGKDTQTQIYSVAEIQ